LIDHSVITTDNIIPDTEEILRHQGIPRGAVVKDHIRELMREAVEEFRKTAEPKCIMREISKSDFAKVFQGEGLNASDSPIGDIYEKADDLALFAVTMGQVLSVRIQELFDQNDFARAAMLDSCASMAADSAAGWLENYYTNYLMEHKRSAHNKLVFGYSPGYCGWNVSAQRKLFKCLQPEKIGITLNDSCLMTPLKSVSGVLIHGDRMIHEFRNGFSFCDACRTQPCLERFDKIYT
jgi:hypothetical protein